MGNINKKDSVILFAPIYDCGSCLNPILEDREIEELTNAEMKNLAINSYSCIKENGKKINYMSYISSMKNEECNKAIQRIFKRINLDKINRFIDSIDCMSVSRKNFYKKMIEIRYNILNDVYNKL